MQEDPALHPGKKGPNFIPILCTGEAPPGRRGTLERRRLSFLQLREAIVAEDRESGGPLVHNIEEAHVARAVSMCMSISRFELIVTSRTRMVST